MADTYEIYTPAQRPVGEPAAAERPSLRGGIGCASTGAPRRFVTVSAICVAIWLMSGAGYFWPMWVMLGTGIPVLTGWTRRSSR